MSDLEHLGLGGQEKLKNREIHTPGYTYCTMCDKAFALAMIEALLCDMPGVRTSLHPNVCLQSVNGEHDWQQEPKIEGK